MFRFAAAATIVVALLGTSVRTTQPIFYPDDPLGVDPETQDASGVSEWSISDPYDFLINTFLEPGEQTNTRAVNVNTIGEVPDSSWFTNRVLARPLSVAEIVRGPNRSDGPAPGPWAVISGKSDGITPGFTIRDTAGVIWFIKFDPPEHPEMATGAEIISTKLFWALGYHVPENHLAVLRRDNLRIAPDATIRDDFGERETLTAAHLDQLIASAAPLAGGGYRVIASRALDGRPVGPFHYHGTRSDDPNDIYPHEHRRELRGLRASAAWLNHDDSRSINTLDTVVDASGTSIVRHHLIDFGSTLGSASVTAQRPRAGNEYIWELRPTLLTMVTLGLWVRPWMTVDYPEIRGVGNFESAFFSAKDWKPEYPNPAFDNARADDLFWAARRVMAISNEAIAAVVESAELTDPEATAYMTKALIERRNKVGQAWLPAINPLVDFRLDPDGTLHFANAASDNGCATAAESYTVSWALFDNATGATERLGEPDIVTVPRADVPASASGARFVQVDVGASHPEHPAWARPVRATFRRAAEGWQLVGLNRLPAEASN